MGVRVPQGARIFNVMIRDAIDISIIIPAKDEEARLPLFMQEVTDYCQRSRFTYEIIVVDDGSCDQTSRVAIDFKKIFQRLTVIHLENNRGKGFAVKTGILAAQGSIVLFLDADGSTPVQEIEKNLVYFDKGFDIVIGSRVLWAQGAVVKSKFYRKLMGAFFNFLVHTFLIKGIYDTQCGFKMFKRAVAVDIFKALTLDGFGFDLEVLYLAQQQHRRIKEVPVNWKHVNGSKIHLVKDSLKMAADIFYIKRHHRSS